MVLLVLRSSIPARKPLAFAERTDTKKAQLTREKCKRSRDPAEDHGNRVGLLAQPVMSERRPGEEKPDKTRPGKSWFVAASFYGPEQSWFDETWRPSKIEVVESADHLHGRDWPDPEICCIVESQPELGACGHGRGVRPHSRGDRDRGGDAASPCSKHPAGDRVAGRAAARRG